MPVTSGNAAPYAPSSAILDILHRHRSRGLPTPINFEVLGRAGITDSLVPRTIQALKALDLIDADGKPTPTFEGLRMAPEAEYKQRMAEWLNQAYADVLNFVDPANLDEATLRDAFRSYTPIGQQSRMVTLFSGLYAAAGIGEEKAKVLSSKRQKAPAASGSAKRVAPKQPQDQNTHEKPPGTPPRGTDGAKPGDESSAFKKELLAKFPPFDPSWPDPIKAQWFDGFGKFMGMASPTSSGGN